MTKKEMERRKFIVLFPLILQISGEMVRSMLYKFIQGIENERNFPNQFCKHHNPDLKSRNTHTHRKEYCGPIYFLNRDIRS